MLLGTEAAGLCCGEGHAGSGLQHGGHPGTLPPYPCCSLLFQAWLKLLYTSRCKKYEQGASMEATLAALENDPDSSQQPGQATTAGGSGTQQQQQQLQQQLGIVQTPGKAAAAAGPQPMALSPLHEAPGSTAAGGGSRGAPAPGWGLHDNLDVIACRADWLYHRYAATCVGGCGRGATCSAPWLGFCRGARPLPPRLPPGSCCSDRPMPGVAQKRS